MLSTLTFGALPLWTTETAWKRREMFSSCHKNESDSWLMTAYLPPLAPSAENSSKMSKSWQARWRKLLYHDVLATSQNQLRTRADSLDLQRIRVLIDECIFEGSTTIYGHKLCTLFRASYMMMKKRAAKRPIKMRGYQQLAKESKGAHPKEKNNSDSSGICCKRLKRSKIKSTKAICSLVDKRMFRKRPVKMKTSSVKPFGETLQIIQEQWGPDERSKNSSNVHEDKTNEFSSGLHAPVQDQENQKRCKKSSYRKELWTRWNRPISDTRVEGTIDIPWRNCSKDFTSSTSRTW